MKRCAGMAVAVLLCMALASPASAQTPVVLFGGAGPSVPLGDFGERADVGWMTGAGLLVLLGEGGLWLGVEGSMGRNAVGGLDGRYSLAGIGTLVGYTLMPDARTRPYVLAGAGVLSLQRTSLGARIDNEAGLSLSAGAGVLHSLTESVSVFGTARYLTADIGENRTNVLPFTIGVAYLMGGGQTMVAQR